MKVNNNENITEFKGNENKTKLNNVRDKTSRKGFALWVASWG
jgi:hypothetical protein